MPFTVLSSKPSEPPFVEVHFNASYLPMLLSVLQDLERATIYEGDSADALAMVINAEDLQDLFMAAIPHTISGCPIGMVAAFPTLLPETSGWLPCDDASWHAQDDYPLLWQYLTDAIADGYNYIVSSTQFLCPNVNTDHRTIIGAGGTGVYESGAIGGAATHTLTTAEMPSHTHTVKASGDGGSGVYTYLNNKTGGTYGGDATGLVNLSGSGSAHNNMPPFMAMYWHISAK